MAAIVTFGEIMARMAPPGVERLRQSLPGRLDVTFAGAEANTAVSLALLGCDVDFVTALPQSPLTEACLGSLRGTGVKTRHVRLTPHGRLGIFFVETGANQRPTQVYYDRDHSSISQSAPGDFCWKDILQDAGWLHLTGITSALSESAAELTLQAAQTARQLGVQVSFDVNFRSKLWRWDGNDQPPQLARRTLLKLLPHVSLWFFSADDCGLLGLAETSLATADSRPRQLVQAAREVRSLFPGIRYFAGTFREQLSASHNNWSGLLFDAVADQTVQAPLRDGHVQPWEIRQIVDRVGSGDAFAAGILFGLSQPHVDLQYTIDFATAAGCLAHSISGDWNYVSRSEIEDLMRGSGAGKVVR
ncbi:MAG: sugar kinase [Planctomycetota bacterium]